ncbi:MAG: TatD family hydrolase [Lachnospiraceae bacterium]|nr:TatD family hydrolase [Lachnospiraceae bacterium]
MIFETHAHYDDEKFDADRIELLLQLKAQSIGRIINVGASFRGAKESVELAKEYDFIYAAVGIHPEDQADWHDESRRFIKTVSDKGQRKSSKVVAIGEIGLDYYWEKDPDMQKRQREIFREQLKIAKNAALPVIIHSRDAAEDTLSIMREAHEMGIEGVIHCYSYSPEIAREYVKMGYYIGIGGVLTFKNSKKLRATVEEIGMGSILLETDSPYMAPEPNRGKRNDSGNLIYVAEKIAEIKGITREEVEEITWENACRLFPEAV